MSKKLKMYVWEDVLTDYTSGLVCILASSLEEALEQAREEFPSYVVEGFAGHEYQVYEKPKAVYVYGGG